MAKTLLENYVEIPIEKLIPAPWNYKKSDDKESKEKLEKLKKNIQKNKQIENLIIRELPKGRFEVVNGNHRLEALTQLGKKSAVCYNLGKVKQAEAERIAIETNETKFEADPIKFAELVAKLTGEFDIEDMVSTLPFNRDQIQNYTQLLKFDWSQYDPALDETSDGEGGDGDGEMWDTVELRLPKIVADLFVEQLYRFKQAIHPDKDPESSSDVEAVECMSAHLAEIPDELIAGD